MFTLYLLFQVMWQFVFVCCNWKIYMAIEVKQTVLFINFYIFWLLCLKWTSSSQGKHIFLGGMNHCWLIHLLLREEARSGGSSCDVWVSCSGSGPLLSLQQLVKSLVRWRTCLSKSLTGGLSEVMNLCKRDWGMGPSEKTYSHLEQHVGSSPFPKDQCGLQGLSAKWEVVEYWVFDCRSEETMTYFVV